MGHVVNEPPRAGRHLPTARFFSWSARSDGFLLLDTLVAVVLLVLALVPLAAVLDRLGASIVRSEERLSVYEATADEEQAAWEWGPRVTDVHWTPAGCLEATVVAQGDEENVRLGIWREGWFLAEIAVGDQGRVTVDVRVLGVLSSAERVTLRARVEDGPWGPPWRTAPGVDSGLVAEAGSPDPEPENSGNDLGLVVHLPTMCSAQVSLLGELGADEVVVSSPLPVSVAGSWAVAEVDGRRQFVSTDNNGGMLPIHVYY